MFTDLSNASKSFLYKRSLLFNSKFDFTKVFHFFAKRVNKIGIAFNNDTEILFNYISSFCGSKKLNIQSFSDLSNNGVNCYIKIQIQPKVTEKRIQRYVFEDKEYHIISGTFILPQAKSLLENQNIIIDGFLLDTTWRIMPYYVTSILTACFMNTSLPIAYAFGHGETKDLYSFLLKTVESQINVKFKGKVFESDQGPSLKSLFKEWGIIHLCCIRHFFHNLKKFDYFYEMKNIINCATQFEYFNCINIFSMHLSEIVDKKPIELTNINKSFKKIGFKFYNRRLELSDPEKWSQITMLNRVHYHMPTTTNSLESTHGHMNHRTPRRNTFYSSIYRIYNELTAKYSNLADRILHNYNYLKNKSLKKAHLIKSEDLISMCAHYKTTSETCLCSENKVESSNYKLDLPCFHRIFMGTRFEPLPDINLTFSENYKGVIVEREFLPKETNNENDEQDRINYSIRTIKQFSKHKKDDEIRQYVEFYNNNEKNGFYIFSHELSVVQVIENGIFYFKELRKRKNLANTPT